VPDTSDIHAEILELLDKYRHAWRRNRLRRMPVVPTEPIVATLVARVRELGDSGLTSIRLVVYPPREFDTAGVVCAAEALAELRDGFSLKSVLLQAATLWSERREHPGDLNTLFRASSAMAEDAYRRGIIDEEITAAMLAFVRAVDDWRLAANVMEAAASVGSSALRDALLEEATFGLEVESWRLEVARGWERREAALYALRRYPELQPTILRLIHHPREHMACAAAKAIIAMLDLLPGNGAEDYEAWKAWAVTRVPEELRPTAPKGLRGRLLGRPRYDRRQSIFWQQCRWEHERCHRQGDRIKGGAT
jgi:hypothetical protein